MFSSNRNAHVTFVEKPQFKIFSFQNFKHLYLKKTKVLILALRIKVLL